MKPIDRIHAFSELGRFLGQADTPEWNDIIDCAAKANPWFTETSIKLALHNWSDALREENLQKWLMPYEAKLHPEQAKTVAVIMAGNIPLVGFHDFLSILLTGHRILIKLSSNDSVLLPFIVKKLCNIQPEFNKYIEFTENNIQNFDAVIATGSNNTARYFDYYFGKYPHIIRKNRNSCAVLNGSESDEDLQKLADDIFLYFGMGCRNVSMLYVPKGYDFSRLFKNIDHYKSLENHTGYKNNYDYYKSIYLIDRVPFLDNGFSLFLEKNHFASPLSVIHYSFYEDKDEVRKHLLANHDQIQCMIGNHPKFIPFGKAQNPELSDYADGVNTLEFLTSLK